MYDFTMPSMGADMTSATLVAWNVEPGERLEKGDIICEIETEKGNIDVEVWEPGVVVELLIEPGEKVPVGEPIARLDDGSGASAGEMPAEQPVAEVSEEPDEPAKTAPATTPKTVEKPAPQLARAEPQPAATRPATAPGRKGKASPAARRLAAELAVSLDELQGSGPGGVVKVADVKRATAHEADGHGTAPHHHHRVTPVARKMAAEAGLDVDSLPATGAHDTVTKADVARALAESGQTPAEAPQADAYSALRSAIARAMARSKREIPHYYLSSTVDVTDTMKWLTAQNAERGIKNRLLFGALATRAVGLAARDVPEMNGFFEDDRFERSEKVHVGFAVAMRGGGVVAPAIHDAGTRSLDETMAAIKDVVRRVRRGKLRSSEMTDPTITLTSLGELGVDTVFGVIYPPQVAIVGVGSPHEAAVAHDGMVGVRTVVELTVSGDHRVSDGMAGSQFLQSIENYLNNPEKLL